MMRISSPHTYHPCFRYVNASAANHSTRHSILYHRGVYPAGDFRTVKKYGQPVLITEDPNLETYISNILKQVERMLYLPLVEF